MAPGGIGPAGGYAAPLPLPIEVSGAWQFVQYWAMSSLMAPHLVQYLVIRFQLSDSV